LINYAYYFLTTFSVDDYVFPDLALDIKKVIPANKYDEAIKIISIPTIVFGYQKYHLALIKAKSVVDLRRVVGEFAWVREYSFQEKLLDYKMAVADKKNLIKQGLKNDILRASADCQRNQKKFSALLRTIKDKKLKMRVKLVNEYINIKTERIETYKIFQTDFRSFFRQLLILIKKNQPRAAYEDMISLTDQEIIDFLKTGRKIDLEQTKKRFANKFVSISINGQTKFIYDLKLIAKIRTSFMSTGEIKEIKGNVVSQGQARGKVKIIWRSSDLSKLKSGDVLVANFTTPEYVPAMKKAIAIVTDDGGITCHAAIISRELNKPCVVGVKIATKVLKDGMMVEVDAERGIVKILKKS
jgi:phosphohistidine swiveling domain-containing protein